jgi:hypothetical protein
MSDVNIFYGTVRKKIPDSFTFVFCFEKKNRQRGCILHNKLYTLAQQ